MKLNLTALPLAALALLPIAGAQTRVTHAPFGALPDGQQVTQYTLQDKQLTVNLITFGAHVIGVLAPDRDGKVADVVLGYKTLDGYLADKSSYMGSVVGRYGNRIAGGKFKLDGQTYTLPVNDKVNTLHGGTDGFDRRNWTAKEIPGGVEFTLISPDGDQGFPGKLTAHVRYTLSGTKLALAYSATTDKDTVLNLTNHSYFNLHGSGDILPVKMMIASDKITPVNATLIPTGGYMQVAGTPFDFNTPTAIGARIHDTQGEAGQQLTYAGGYDHNFVLRSSGAGLHLAARAIDPSSGRTLTVTTTEPGVQFYSGNFLNGTLTGRDGMVYTKNTGFCLETQHYPDSPNQPQFPSTELKPGQTMHSQTVFEFGTDKVSAQ